MSGAGFAGAALDHPAFSVFEPQVRARLAELTHFPEPHQLRALAHGIPRAVELWFDFAVQDDAALLQAGGFDALIAQSARIPTRAGSFHDLLGALMWLHFPALKTAIHHLQLAAEGARRGPRENAATHLDESGVLVVSSDVRVFQALSELRWERVFCDPQLAIQTRFLAFGHGLLDTFRAPHPRLMGKALCVRVEPEQWQASASELRVSLDRRLAARLASFLLEPGQLQPLPVLGVPGWADAQTPEFYANQQYFRRARRRERSQPASAWLELE